VKPPPCKIARRAAALLLGGAALLSTGAPPGAAALEKDEGAEALRLLKEAYARRHSYGEDFPGFEAKLACDFGPGRSEGRVRVSAAGEVDVELPELEARLWVSEQLSIMIAHRLRQNLPEANTLRLEPADGHPLGRRLAVKDSFQTGYRLREGRITEIERTSPPVRFVVTILEYAQAEDGKDLPRHFIATYFESETGRLLRSFVFQDSYRKLEKYALPAKRLAVGSADGGTHTASFELSGHKLLPSKEPPREAKL
jgi:hypothetical protein